MHIHLRGFTLIELLVVIAIIGVLSSVILTSLNTARNKGNDASIKADLNSIRIEAGLDYDSLRTYGSSAGTGNWASSCDSNGPGTGTPGSSNIFDSQGGLTDGDSSIYAALTGARAAAPGSIFCGANGTSFVIIAPLNDGTYWCTDSLGNSKAETVAPPTTSSAPPTGYGTKVTGFICI